MRNTFEDKVGQTLEQRWQYEAIKLPYVVAHTYTPDWVDTERKEIVEAKGYFDATDRRKMKCIREQYPDWSITIIFQNPHAKLHKRSKTTYAGWCEKNGIAWSAL